MFKTTILFFLFTPFFLLYGQSVKGVLPAHAGQQIKIFQYQGVTSHITDSTIVDTLGHFKLALPQNFEGMGYLKTSDNSFFNLILNGNSIELEGVHLKESASITILTNQANKNYNTYNKENTQRENVLAGWKYLLQQYNTNVLFQKEKQQIKNIEQNIKEVEQQDALYIQSLDEQSYTKYILPIQKLVRGVPMSAKHYTERISEDINNFRKLDYTDNRLYNSGFLDDVVQAHYWLIENSGKPIDSVFIEMNTSTDYLLESLQNDEKILNEVTDYLFDLLEKHSLFKASEYLALKVLTQNSCTLNDDLANQLETYRAMKVGNVAQDISFSGLTIKNGVELPKNLKLTNIQTQYKLVMFGASWCPKCTEELPRVKELYNKWLNKGMDVMFISLDNNKDDFTKFAKNFPWVSTCDFKQWETQAAKDYYVFSTPTLFLLDKNNKILLRPNSVKQVDAWLDFYIK